MKIKDLVLLVVAFGSFSSLIPSVSAQTTVVTYQGRVQSNGTNFSGSGLFKVALVTETNLNHTATATANPPSGGFITIINVTAGGNGYLSAPTVTITGGGGANATATASLSGGVVTSITVNNPGGGYSSTPTVTIAPPPENLLFATYWSNDGTSSAGSQPASAVSASVASGLFTLRLGDPTLANMTALPEGLFQQDNLRVRLWFNDGVSGFATLSPTQPLTASPYASYAATARSVTAGSNQPVQLSINGIPVLRITQVNDPFAGITVNSVGGASANFISNGVVGGFIGGGGQLNNPNRVGGSYAAVPGGRGNTASGYDAMAMGYGNLASGPATMAIGALTTASGEFSAAMGHYTIASGNSSMAMGDSTRASGNSSTAMGNISIASGDYSTAMGFGTMATGFLSTAMGFRTTAGGDSSTAMGDSSTASGQASVAMGYGTTASGNYSMAAGYYSQATNQGSFVWADSSSTTPFASTANNQFLLRASGGVGINTNNPGGAALAVNGVTIFNGNMGINTATPQAPLHVWGRAIVNGVDGWDVNNTDGDLRVGTTTYRFKIGVSQAGGGAGDVWMRAQGGTARMFIKTPGGTTFYSNESQTAGVSLAAGGGAWTTVSDRNAKENFQPVNATAVLEKVAALPLSTWNYKSQAANIQHLGPMAQDFKAAFGLGESDTGITTVDADGVAFAAIQGLNQKLTEELKRRDAENTDLKLRLERLEMLLVSQANGGAK